MLYDLWAEHGGVEENVFAYSNQRDGQRALIVYNNSYGSARGTLHHSAAYMDKGAGQLRQRALADALDLPTDEGVVLGYRNSATGLHHLRRATDVAERGMPVDLRGYQYMTLLDWRELRSDASHDWHRLCDLLGGRGVEDLDRALLSLELEHLHQALRAALAPRLVREVASLAARTADTVADDASLLPHSELLEDWIEHAGAFVELARAEYIKRVQPPPPAQPQAAGEDEPELLAAEACNEDSLTATHLRERVQALLRLPLAEEASAVAWPKAARAVLPSASPVANAGSVWSPVLAYTLVAAFAESLDPVDPRKPAVTAFDQLGLRSVLAESFAALEFQGQDTWRAAARVRLALQVAPRATPEAAQHGLTREAWQDGDLRWLAGVNEHEGTTYFNQESLEQLLWWHALPRLLHITGEPELDATALRAISDNIDQALASAAKAGYRLEAETEDAHAGIVEPPFAEHIEAHLKDAPALALEAAVEPLDAARPEAGALVKGEPEPEIASKIAKLKQEGSERPMADASPDAAPKKPASALATAAVEAGDGKALKRSPVAAKPAVKGKSPKK